MTIEQLEDRKAQLSNQLTQMNQNAFVIHGHIQEIDFQIAHLKALEEKNIEECCDDAVECAS